jgi:hypothetical protein
MMETAFGEAILLKIRSCRALNFVYRCFPHVINIAVMTMVKKLKDNPYAPVIATCHEEAGPSEALIEYAKAVKSDPIGTAVGIVAVCRKSGQRRAKLQQIILEGNHDNAWPDGSIRPLQLLRQCETRWSSTFNMIGRCIELYPVRVLFLINVTLLILNNYYRPLSSGLGKLPWWHIVIFVLR